MLLHHPLLAQTISFIRSLYSRLPACTVFVCLSTAVRKATCTSHTDRLKSTNFKLYDTNHIPPASIKCRPLLLLLLCGIFIVSHLLLAGSNQTVTDELAVHLDSYRVLGLRVRCIQLLSQCCVCGTEKQQEV